MNERSGSTAVLWRGIPILLALVLGCEAASDQEPLAQRSEAAASELPERLWPHYQIHYLAHPDVEYAISGVPEHCDDPGATGRCQRSLRDWIELGAAYYQERTALSFTDETSDYHESRHKTHDHPHLFFDEINNGQTYSFTILKRHYRSWKARCEQAPGCDLELSPDENSGVHFSEHELVAWKFVRDGYEILRPAACAPRGAWSIDESTGDGVLRQNCARPHDDYLITLPPRVYAADSPDPALVPRNVLHELGHALGMMHEQKRPDRGQSLYYFPCHVEPGGESAFEIEWDSRPLSPYDVASIMQYDSASKCITSGGSCLFPLLSRTRVPGIAENAVTYLECASETPSPKLVTGYQIKAKDALSPEDVNVLWQLYPARSRWSDDPGDRFGSAVAAGDFDGDGYDDLAVGAPGETVLGNFRGGAVYVYKGTHTGLTPWRRLANTAARQEDGFGSSLAAGDVNGDARADLVVGVPGGTATNGERGGVAWLYFGEEFGPGGPVMLSPGTAFSADAPSRYGDGFGSAIAIGNFDASPPEHHVRSSLEIAIGAPGKDAVYVFRHSGEKLALLRPAPASKTPQLAAKARFGAALAAAHLPSDTLRSAHETDLVIGAPASAELRGEGTIYVARGGSSLAVPQRVDQPGRGNAKGDRFGHALAVGRFASTSTEVAVGAPGHSDDRGRAYVLSLVWSMGSIRSTRLLTLRRSDLEGVGDARGAQFGFNLAAVPGATSDGLAISAPGASGSNVGIGLVNYYPPAAELGAAVEIRQPTYQGPAGGFQSFGWALSAGQFDNRNGYDLALSVPRKNSEAGAVWVSRGSGSLQLPNDDVWGNRFATFLSQSTVYNHWQNVPAALVVD